MNFNECMILIDKVNKLVPNWWKTTKVTSWEELKKLINNFEEITNEPKK